MMLNRKALVFAMVASLFFMARAMASTDYEKAGAIMKLPLGLSNDGKLVADSSKWKIEKDPEGTEMLSLVKGLEKGTETRAAFMRNTDGTVDAFASFSVKGGAKSSEVKGETSNGLFYSKGHLAAITTCEETAKKDSIGRICVTATPRLCQGLRSGAGVDPDSLKEMESYEMRALASILTLRGSEHQLDNVVRFGNKLGLKTALQTTKGQLMTLAKQVAKEQAQINGPATAGLRAPASDEQETKMARAVLETTMSRLKDSCGQF